MFAAGTTSPVAGGRMADKLEILWGQTRLLNDRNGDQTIGLTMDKAMGSAFGSKTSYLFARIDISIKLVPKNSAGTVTTIYVSDTPCPSICHARMHARVPGVMCRVVACS
jgi:xyloglucan:xyloglucosyl transferase